jgi:hypothetical protein
MTHMPATSAADANLAPLWWQTFSRLAWKRHAKRAGVAAAVVVAAGAMVSVYLDKAGWISCSGAGDTCVETHFYAFTAQPRVEETTVGTDVVERREWFPTGAVWIEGKYEKGTGKRTGEWRENYDDGQPRFVGTYVNDEIEGTETWFYPSGAKEWEIGRKAGARDGEERWYHVSGALRRIGSYKGGERDGTFTVYDEDGRVAFTGEYKDGVNVSGKAID